MKPIKPINVITALMFATGCQSSFDSGSEPGSTAAIAGPIRVQFEDFNQGGEGVGYHDIDAENAGGKYRTTEGVDLEARANPDGYNVGWVQQGEWLKYNVTVPADGTYALQARVAVTPFAGMKLSMSIDNGAQTIELDAADGPSIETYQLKSLGQISLGAGPHTIVANVTQGSWGINLDYMELTQVDTSGGGGSDGPTGTLHYVSPNGSDSNAGTIDSPWQHIHFAVNNAAVAPGDGVIVRGGTYRERVEMTRSGIAGGNIYVQAYPSETPVIDGTNVTWEWDGLAQGLFEVRSSFVVVDGIRSINALPNPSAVGILVRGPNVSHVTVRNCSTENTRSSGIAIWGNAPRGSYDGATDIVIEKNTIVNAVNDGYQEHLSIALGVERYEIRYNTVRDGSQVTKPRDPNIPIGIDSKVNVRNGKVYGNTVLNLPYGAAGIYVDGWDDHAYNIEIFDNIVHDISGTCFQIGAEEGGKVNAIWLRNNLAVRCGNNGLAVNQAYGNGTIDDITFYNNTVYKVEQGSAIVFGQTGPVRFLNNILADGAWNNGIHIYSANKANVQVDNNLVWAYRGRTWNDPQMEEVVGTRAIQKDPGFASIGDDNFRLGASSPAIDAADASLVPAQDLDGTARPLLKGYDIGAYEYRP
jgi:hypothetical protein